MERFTRMMMMLRTRTTRRFSAEQLAETLDCDTSTVVRDIEVMEHMLNEVFEGLYSIEVTSDGKRNLYRLKTLTQTGSLGFDNVESLFIDLCRDLAGQFLPAENADRVQGLLNSVTVQAAEADGSRSRMLGFRGKGTIDYRPHMATLAALRSAIALGHICEITYQTSRREAPRTHRYAPRRIMAMNGILYVHGLRLEEGSLISDRRSTLLAHRIHTVRDTGEHPAPVAMDFDSQHFGLFWHAPRRFTVTVDAKAADYVRERVWSDDQVMEDLPDGGLRLTLTSTSEKELQAWVWSFGGLARLEPADGEAV